MAPAVRTSNWLEKNLLVASHTGYNTIVNAKTSHKSLLEFQIDLALSDERTHPLKRFYFRQVEYFDNRLAVLADDRDSFVRMYEAESDYCDAKVKSLKTRLAKKGIAIKYYKSLEQLDALVYTDFVEMVKGNTIVTSYLKM